MIIILYSSASHSSTPEEVKVSSRRAYYYYDDDDDDIFDGDGRTTTDILSSNHTGVFITSLFVRLAGGVLGGIVFFFRSSKRAKSAQCFHTAALSSSARSAVIPSTCPEEPFVRG